jgi:hypothetical protein
LYTHTTQGPEETQTQLRRQFKQHFRNISKILDCVACEKCKLWGKIQLNGLGTALKILFELSSPHRQNGNSYPSSTPPSKNSYSQDDSSSDPSSTDIDPKGYCSFFFLFFQIQMRDGENLSACAFLLLKVH